MSTLEESLRLRREAETVAVSHVTSHERQSSLIVSVWAGESWVLPWAQFVSARLDRGRIDLTFANCQVIVTGENLHVLLDDIAAYRLGSLRELPPEYRLKPAAGDLFVARIEVRPATSVSVREAPA